jgi:putative transposase
MPRRAVASGRNEVLDHFIIFGPRHLDSLLTTFLAYYHRSRPHQGRSNQLLVKSKSRRKTEPPDKISISQVRCEQKLGGLLKSYSWAA